VLVREYIGREVGLDEPEVGDAGGRAVRRELDPQRAGELLEPGLARCRTRSLPH
jgi:hypothetical protein